MTGRERVKSALTFSTPDRVPRDLWALGEGPSGNGSGFVLMPSASPYGRELSPLTLKNYEKMIGLVEAS